MLFKDAKCPNCEAYHDPTLKQCPSCHNKNELFTLNRLPKRVLFLHPIAQAGMFLVGFAYTGLLITESILFILFDVLKVEASLNNILTLSFGYILLLAGLLAIPLATRRKEFLGKYKNGIDYIYGIAYAATIISVGTIVGALIALFHETADNVNQETAVSIVTNYPLIAFVILGVVGPVCEELTYRVGLYSFLRRINKYLAFAVTVIVFTLIHFDFAAEDIITELWSLPSYIICGFILTLAYEHRGPACSMVAHSIYNITACLMILAE